MCGSWAGVPRRPGFSPPCPKDSGGRKGKSRAEHGRRRAGGQTRADAGRTGGVSALRPARRRVPTGRVGVPQRQSGARGGVRGPSSRRERKGRAGLGPWRWGADAPRVSAAGPLCPGPVQPSAWPTPAPRGGGPGRRRTAVCPGASPVPGSLPSAGVGEVEQSPRPHRPPQRPGCHPSSCGPESQCPFPARPLRPGPAGSGRLLTPLRPPPPPAAFPLWPSQVPALRPPHSDEQVRPPPCPALVVGLGLPPNGHLGPCPAVALSMRRQPLRDSLELHTTGKVTVWGHLFLGRKSLGSVSRPSFLDKAGLSTGPVSAAR